MSGKPKNYNFPIVEFLVENGRVKIADMPHHGHDAPKRYKENIWYNYNLRRERVDFVPFAFIKHS